MKIMKLLLTGIIIAVTTFSMPVMAQTIEDQVAAQLAASGIDPATASQAQIDAALNSVLLAAIEAQLGGSAATATPDQLAAAVSTLLTNNPNLSTGAVAALVSAASSANPAAASAVAGAAVAARPADAVQITRAAVEAVPLQATDIAQAAAVAAQAAGATLAEIGAIVTNAVDVASNAGVIVAESDVASAVATVTGLDASDLEANVVAADVVATVRTLTVDEIEVEGGSGGGCDENASPIDLNCDEA